MKKLTLKITLEKDEEACSFLAEKSGLSKSRIKLAMNAGAVTLTRRGRKPARLRRASATLRRGDTIELFYDEKILLAKPPEAELVCDHTQYSIWFKPPGLLTQPTRFGDRSCLLHQASIHFNPPRKTFPVHRLDREVSGFVIVAHTSHAASVLSGMIRNHLITKGYTVTVAGRLEGSGTIELPLDGKKARSFYRSISYDPGEDTSVVEVKITTGRLHQVRRHMCMTGHPVIGDPRYGRGNKNEAGLMMRADVLEFTCPFTGKLVSPGERKSW